MGAKTERGHFRRKYPRRAFRRSVGVLFDGEYYVATSGEIGEGGISIVATKHFEMGRQIVMSFRIPGGDFVSLRGEVRSSEADSSGVVHTHGVLFSNIQFTHKRQIRSYVSARTESESLII